MSEAWTSGGPDAIERGRSLARLLVRHGARLDRILDVGCGAGGMLRGVAATDLAVGIDVDEPLVRHVRDAGPEAHGLLASGTRMPFPDATFDLVVMFDVLEHVSGWPYVLLEAGRVLRPGGVAFVTAANTWSPITVLDDPHWHVPLLAIAPRWLSRALVDRFDPRHHGREGMGGDHPVYPSWAALQRAFRAARLEPTLLSNAEKLSDPDSVVGARRRRIARLLASRIRSAPSRAAVRAAFDLYDRWLARSWSFLARRTASP